MTVEATGSHQRSLWQEQRAQLWWLRSLAVLALALCLLGAGIGIMSFARVTAELDGRAMAVILLAVGTLAGRVDILSQALDASPDAELILAPSGRAVHTNMAFHRLFPGWDEKPLERMARAVGEDPQAQADFRRLRDQAAAGGRAIAALFLRDARGGAGWFNI